VGRTRAADEPGLPRTLTGKKLEVPAKRIVRGRPADATVSMGSIDRPELLGWFEEFSRRRKTGG
jgi:acetoacetyl-CoA synthetase